MPELPPSSLQKKLDSIRRDAEERDVQRAARERGVSYVDLRTTPVSADAVRLIPEQEAKEGGVVAAQLQAKSVAVALVEPNNPRAQQIIQGLVQQGYAVKQFMASQSGVAEAWRLYQFVGGEAKEITGKLEVRDERLVELSARLTTVQAVHDEIAKIDLKTISTTAFMEVILAGIVPNRVSDLHFEAQEKSGKLRFRIDGVLHDVIALIPERTYESLVTRIKLLSGLKMNVHGEAQDGRFTIGLGNKKNVEMRVSIIPSEFGETIVMRVLDPDSIKIDLPGLGLRADDLLLIEQNLAKPNGLILNTGPTGSGKTTTLYAFLNHVNKPDVKIITVEDPIEYHLQGISQTQVNSDVGYTFASGLRSILRQDPDVILVGEIRDQETSDIAMQASLTGHLVFSTLHTNSAVGAVPRLIDLGVKAQTIGPALSLVIAQRLVRRLCKECKKPTPVTPEMQKKITNYLAALPARVDRSPYTTPTLFAPAGCAVCNSFGYRGRIGVYEFLEFGSAFEQLIMKDTSESAMTRLAEQQAMVTMQQDGVLKAIAGITTFEEVEEATGPIAWPA